jgi:large subunit ribosomal protein L37Ae
MAGKNTKHGSVKRFGTRYGRTLKNKMDKVEAMQQKEYRCPECHYEKVERLSLGIWECGKCKAKFTSKAYTVAKLPSLKMTEKEE